MFRIVLLSWLFVSVVSSVGVLSCGLCLICISDVLVGSVLNMCVLSRLCVLLVSGSR